MTTTGIPRFTLLMWGDTKKMGKQKPWKSSGEAKTVEIEVT